MKIVGKYHVTATEKRHIKQIIAKGWLSGSTKRKSYSLTKTETGFDVRITTPEISDFGRRQNRISTATVTL